MYGLVQYCSISIANTQEMLQSCTKPLISIHEIFRNYTTLWVYNWETNYSSGLHGHINISQLPPGVSIINAILG